MPGRLDKKVAVITGASSGLGRAIAILYSKEGASVVCADINPTASIAIGDEATKATHELLNESGGKAIFVKTDVREASSVQALVKSAVDEFGRLDIMVNNAGIAFETKEPRPLGIWETPEASFDQTFAINCRGVWLGCKYAGAQMITQDPHPSGDRGWIINTASILGLVGAAGTTCYATSKGAVVNMTRSAALDFAPHRIHCNAVCPGYTRTAMLKPLLDAGGDAAQAGLNAMHPFRGLGEAQDIAKAMLFLASEDASWVTGTAMVVDGGYTAQ